MKRNLLILCALVMCAGARAQWQPVGDKIKTPWTDKVSPANVLPEYPRPLMVRDRWINLNGLWDYAIRPAGEAAPDLFDGKILVPFAVESSLSGVGRTVGKENELWYNRHFELPAAWKSDRVLLHFGAVDWKADVMINGMAVGSHKGGYTPFSFDITPYLLPGKVQKLTVCVWDPTDDGYQPRGKQVKKPEGIWYTPVTGIWQTVWLEPVPAAHITAVKPVADIDRKMMEVAVETAGTQAGDIVEVILSDEGKTVATAKGAAGMPLRLSVPQPKLWSPCTPFLYQMKVVLWRGGKKTDEVASYTAMRKISTQRDKGGVMRMTLNNEPLFQYGPLDQGWWPDGLYTAPTDEALVYDIQKTKDFGFNMIRKHVKVEPARWYYHCDRLGVLVWQDMPNGDHGEYTWEWRVYNGGNDCRRSQESKENFHREWKEAMDLCYANPSVVVWVPFNEAWGQFETEKVAEWTKNYDPSRLVNPASGGNHRPCGDMLDLHHYPNPKMFLSDPMRVNVLGEYGGIGLALDGHLWWNERNWGYVQFKSSEEVTDQYVKYAEELRALVPLGFSAAIYTQTTDVEGEVNGLMTYDRKVLKLDEKRVAEANRKVIESMK